MPSDAIRQYYDATENRKIRDDLVFAVGLVDEPKIAIDCGCGAGADIAFLVAQGFLVHGFDVEDEAIARCKARFKDDVRVVLSTASFSTFQYPSASLLVADASLFFCPRSDFAGVWQRMTQCLTDHDLDGVPGTTADVAAFMADHLANSLRADINGDNALNAADIVAFNALMAAGLGC